MQRGQRHLGGAGEEELVLGDLVDLVAVAGQEAGPVERLLAHQHRRHDRLVALGAEQLERVADERELEHHQVAHQVGEARAGGPGGGLDLDQPEGDADLEVVARLEVERRRLPHLAQGDGVLLGSSRRGRRRPAGSAACAAIRSRSASTCASSDCIPFSRPFSSRISAIAASASPPARFASAIASEAWFWRGAPALDLRQQLPAAGVEAEQLVHLLGGAAARQRLLHPLGLGPDQLQVEHRPASRSARPRGCGAGSLSRPWGLLGLGAGVLGDEARRPASACSPTTMFCGMIAPEKPPFGSRRGRRPRSPGAGRGSAPAPARRGCRCPGRRRP